MTRTTYLVYRQGAKAQTILQIGYQQGKPINQAMGHEGEKEKKLNVACRALVHLLPYVNYENERYCPEEMTQRGIAASVGVCRPFVTKLLNRLVTEGLIQCMTKHAFTSSREEKAYVLTEKGVKLAKEIRLTFKTSAGARDGFETLKEPAERGVAARA